MQAQKIKFLHDTIKEWISRPVEDRNEIAVYSKLDHKYTQASISFGALKGRDKAQVEALQRISLGLPVEIFLAVVERKETGSCEYTEKRYSSRGRYGTFEVDGFGSDYNVRFHPLVDVIGRDHKILSLVNMNGDKLMSDMPFNDKDAVLQSNFFKVVPKENYTGYMGNWVRFSHQDF